MKELRKAAVIACLFMILASCSGSVSDAPDLVDKMIDAYGGRETAAYITTYSGKGFMKKLPFIHVAESSPFDVDQRGLKLKNKLMSLNKGKLIDIRILVADGENSYTWTPQGGRSKMSAWEHSLLRYRFPYVLEWLSETDIPGTLLEPDPESGMQRLRYTNGDDILTLLVDSETWMLRETIVESVSDSSFVTRDVYSDYRKIDGIPFASRFKGYFKGSHYYEYYLVKVEFGVDLPDGIFTVLPADTSGLQPM